MALGVSNHTDSLLYMFTFPQQHVLGVPVIQKKIYTSFLKHLLSPSELRYIFNLLSTTNEILFILIILE